MLIEEGAVRCATAGSCPDNGECVIIENPTAGSGDCDKLLGRALDRFEKAGLRFSVIKTQRPGEATELAEKALLSGAKTIIAAGGDGTIREVVSALAYKDVTVGLLPFGTGNDFASALSIPTDPYEAAALILNGTAKKTDLAAANGTIFTNVCGIGFDVEVLRRVEKHKKGRKGMFPYALGIIDALFHRKKLRARIAFDGEEPTELDALLITMCNGKRFGGGMLVAPDACSDDGLFDVCIAKWLGFFRMIVLLPLFLKGGHIGKKPVIYRRASAVSVTVEGTHTVETDGELIESTPLEARILPGALNIIRP